jgi:hypothetical protein
MDTSDLVLCPISHILYHIFSLILEPNMDHSDISIYLIYILEIQFRVFGFGYMKVLNV